MHIPSLKSKRLVLRAPQPSDAPAIEQSFATDIVSRNLSRVPYPYPQGAALDWIEKAGHGRCRVQPRNHP